MAQLAIPIVVAAAAGGAAAAAGLSASVALTIASLAFSIVSLADSVLFPIKGPTVYGSRIGDLTVTASTYGVVRPVVVGTVQVAGNIIWATPIAEVATSSDVGGGGKGGGKGGGQEVNYTYTATFALALCEGPIEQVTRIWMNGAIVYDITSQAVTPAPPVLDILGVPIPLPSSDPLSPTNPANAPVSFRFYPGSTTQLPDSLIEADKGVGNVPGYRGLCYLVFDALLLTNFGDRIPNVQVEVSSSAVFSQQFQELNRNEYGVITYDTVDLSGYEGDAPGTIGYMSKDPELGYLPGPDNPLENIIFEQTEVASGAVVGINYSAGNGATIFESYGSDAIAVNPLTLVGYVWGEAPLGISEFDLSTMSVIAEYTLDYMLNSFDVWTEATADSAWMLWVGFDQQLYGLMGGSYFKVNPATFRNGSLIGLGNDDNLGSPFSGNVAAFGAPLGLIGPAGMENYTIFAGGNLNHLHIFDLDNTLLEPSSGNINCMCPGKVGPMLGQTYVLSVGSSTLYIDRVQIQVTVDIGLTGVSYGRTGTLTNVLALEASDIQAGATGWLASGGMVYDSIDDSVVFQAQVNDGGPNHSYLIKWSTSGGVVWSTQFPSGIGVNLVNQCTMASDLRSGKYALFSDETALQFDLSSGEIVGNFPWALNNNGGQVYSGAYNAILMASTGPYLWDKIQVGLLSFLAPTLDTLVTDICQLAGMTDGDIDVTGISTIPIDGYALSNRTAAKDALIPLMQLYQIDVVERDYVLVFQRRGGDIVTTVTQDDMMRVSDKGGNTGEPYIESRAQEKDLPMRYTVTYVDESVQYQANTQAAKRIVFPDRSMYSDQQIDLQVGLVMAPDAAAQQAETLLYTAWLERHTFKVTLPPDFMYLDPADAVTLVLDSGYTARARLVKPDTGADGSMQVTLVTETDGQYVSTAIGAEGNLPPNVIPYYVTTKMMLLDIPLLRDIDDTAGTAIRAYWGASPYSSAGTWTGAQLQASQDSDIWSALDVETTAAAWGYLESALDDAASSFHIHDIDSIVVKMQNRGTALSDCTETQLANGINAAAVFKANGDVEIIGYLTVTPYANNRYLLTGLARGQRGTDSMAFGHAPGEVFLPLNTSVIDPIALPLAARGVVGFYRAVTYGEIPSAATIQPQTFHGRDQMPYAPVQLEAASSGSDIVLTWVRRCRVNSLGIGFTDNNPVGESSELYSIDIYDALGETVLRTLSATSQTVTYLSADITADFGGPITTINVSVYQISATVGRGFATLESLEVDYDYVY